MYFNTKTEQSSFIYLPTGVGNFKSLPQSYIEVLNNKFHYIILSGHGLQVYSLWSQENEDYSQGFWNFFLQRVFIKWKKNTHYS